eukprot:scaffold94569_cov19-Tisochrysis_lutea.AAC.1
MEITVTNHAYCDQVFDKTARGTLCSKAPRPGAGTFQHTEAETVNEETEEKGYVHRMQNQCYTTGAHKERGAWATWDVSGLRSEESEYHHEMLKVC